MRTKSLLLAAVLSAAGLAIASAQGIYSVNVVGYVTVSVPAGYSIIANPLSNQQGNDLDTILPSVDIGTTIYTWDGAAFVPSVFFGTWAPNVTLAPGEGAFIEVAAATDLVFVGEVMQGDLVNQIPAGLSLRASQVPISEDLDTIGFPAEVGDTVYFYRNGGYEPSVYFGTFAPAAVPGIGEGFWVEKANAADWTRTFNVQ